MRGTKALLLTLLLVLLLFPAGFIHGEPPALRKSQEDPLLLNFRADTDYGSFSGVIDWVNMRLELALNLNLEKAGVRLPAGRILAEKMLAAEYLAALKEAVSYIQVDSSSGIARFFQRGEIYKEDLEDIALSARSVPPAVSRDMRNMRAEYSVNMSDIAAKLAPREPAAAFPVIPGTETVRDYTGIVIIVPGKLPVHGKFAEEYFVPCLFPGIWDSDMNLIFDKNRVDPEVLKTSFMVRYKKEEDVFGRGASGMSDGLREIAGDRPLRIIASGLSGIVPADIIIAREDALLILSSPANKNLLYSGRVAIISGISN